jgi:hypothetical protein
MYNHYDSSPTLNDCTFSQNIAERGGAMYIDGWDGECRPVVNNCAFTANSAESFGGAIGNEQSSPTLKNCTFTANSTYGSGGGMYNIVGTVILKNCIFRGNSAESGAAMDNSFNSLVLNNCLFTGNSAEYAAGIHNFNNHLELTNCTFAGNSLGSISSSHHCTLDITSCIFWGNAGSVISAVDEVDVTVNYSDLQGGWPGMANIDADPWFVDLGHWDSNGTPKDPKDDVWVDGDYHLLPGSPCIDAGDPNYVAEPDETDLDGKPRVMAGRIDMGAYESPIPAEARIVPRTINLASKGKTITCYICFPEEYNIADIDSDMVYLNGQTKPEAVNIDEQQQVAAARFNREDVQATLGVGEIEITITGRLNDGNIFEGTDTIKVTNKTVKK